ncbi:hypothetical protein [Agrococcus jejuensis]|uniref:Uncharacterized protein n=1 Tax=Agrococcus jejuensis TaxID=399736 RepID=A0A1G8BQW8_9MICO|nr:hypothetical protein [Agrococcus jejuensis]SDH35514.1 hypothetical protein SAMN04489720_1025 [Agrococcus jejuensis]
MHRLRRIALAVAGIAALAGCVVVPPAASPVTEPPVAPAPSATAAPSPTPTLAPTTPSPTPTAPAAGPAVVDGGCSTAFLEEAMFGYDATTIQPGFTPASVLDGLAVACAATQPSDILDSVGTYALALIPAGDGVLADLDARILATGLVPNQFVAGIYEDAVGDPIAFLEPLPDMIRISELSPVSDADLWVAVQWYAKP